MEDEDFLLALQLQEQFNNEGSPQIWGEENSDMFPVSKKRKVDSPDWSVEVQYRQPVQPERPLSIVDESWEMLDPNPDIRGLFLQYNSMFFWEKLSGVEVKWSPRMTLCAGLCSYEGRGGLCSIRLSEPLLKLRPRKDLVETLLHEMIHALLFVTQNNRDRDGHGPEFCKHMNRINQASGTKISVYHSFHDEVDVYRQHWWRCNGPCQHRKPFFGYVKRAMNRAPSARDPWWADHQRTCGGTYTKIKEPENYGKSGKNTEKKDKKGVMKSPNKISPATSTAGSGSQDIRNIIPFSGRGFVLGGSARPSGTIQKPASQGSTPSPQPVQEAVQTSPPVLKPPYSVPVLPKRSVSNTKAFVNINGSPVRITNDNKIFRPKQRTVQDLFQTKSLNSSEKCNASSSASKPGSSLSAVNQTSNGSPLASDSNQKSSSITNSPHNSVAPRTGTAGSPFSKYFGSPKRSGNGIPVSRPTSFGIQSKPESSVPRTSLKQSGNPKSVGTAIPSSSSTTYGAYKKLENPIHGLPVSGSDNLPGANSSPSRSPVRPGHRVPNLSVRPVGSPNKSGPSLGGRKRQMKDRNSANIFEFFQRTCHSPTSAPRRQDGERDAHMPAAGASGASDVSLGSSTITVHCPVCQKKVLESQINEHLDSCLK